MPEIDERIQRDKATILSIIKFALILLLIIGSTWLIIRIALILMPFVIGFILAKIAIALVNTMHSLSRKLLRQSVSAPAADQPADPKKEKREKLFRLIVYFLLVIFMFSLFGGLVYAGIHQATALIEQLKIILKSKNAFTPVLDWVQGISNYLGGFLSADLMKSVQEQLQVIQSRLFQFVSDNAGTVLAGIVGFVGRLPAIIFYIIVTIMSGFYYLNEIDMLRVFFRRNVTSGIFREKTVLLINQLSSSLFRVIGGYLVLLLITFFLCLISLWAINMPYAVVIALVAAIVDFLPVLGLSTTMIPISVYMFVNGNTFGGIGALVALALMTIIRRWIEPLILGNATKLHPLATLLSMVVGIALYGLAGLLVGPVLFIIAKEVMEQYGLTEKLRNFAGTVLDRIVSPWSTKDP